MTATRVLTVSLTAATLSLLAACAGPAQTTLEDGTVAYKIDCQASAAGLNYCFEKAGKSCGADGYLIVGRDGQVLGDSEVAASDNVKVVSAWQTDRNSIYIRCDT
ncbi:MAG: hypothetical protein AAFX10_00625 [Pseudomonadota bacterium]